jgi:hypothetical protein
MLYFVLLYQHTTDNPGQKHYKSQPGIPMLLTPRTLLGCQLVYGLKQPVRNTHGLC